MKISLINGITARHEYQYILIPRAYKERKYAKLLPISDYYKEHEHKIMRIKMASCTSHSIHSPNYSDNVDNPTALLFLVALFYEKGEISTATSLLKSIHK